VITDENGSIVGSLHGKDLIGDDPAAADPSKVGAFLQKHSPSKIDARELFTDTMERARRENKRVFIQQTATWCGPCWSMSRYLDKHRAIWEKDFIWIKMDERWLNADDVMKPIRKGAQGGIPWMAILNADGKVLATSNTSEGENIGFPYPSEPEGIQHFLTMLKSTAQRLTEGDLALLKQALEKK
jgi:hypothetical protein